VKGNREGKNSGNQEGAGQKKRVAEAVLQGGEGTYLSGDRKGKANAQVAHAPNLGKGGRSKDSPGQEIEIQRQKIKKERFVAKYKDLRKRYRSLSSTGQTWRATRSLGGANKGGSFINKGERGKPGLSIKKSATGLQGEPEEDPGHEVIAQGGDKKTRKRRKVKIVFKGNLKDENASKSLRREKRASRVGGRELRVTRSTYTVGNRISDLYKSTGRASELSGGGREEGSPGEVLKLNDRELGLIRQKKSIVDSSRIERGEGKRPSSDVKGTRSRSCAEWEENRGERTQGPKR